MFSKKLLTCFLVLTACLAGISCGRTPAFAHLSNSALLDIARGYNPTSRPGQVLAAAKPVEQPTVPPQNLQTQMEYASQIKQYFSQGDFDQLEKMVYEARNGKGRVLGGTWKVAEFCDAIYATFIGEHADDSDWRICLDSLKQWVIAKPESAAARISLAEAYVSYGWLARGTGYASTVTSKGWKLYRERVAMGAATLAEAARLKEKCPYWYEAMQTVSLSQGWDKAQARELMELAVAAEPGYYHFYREYAFFLQPKWYGDEGEVEAFAAEVADRVSGPQGDMLYFEIASLVSCQCDAEKNALQNMSWPRIKQGYAALAQQYGVSTLKRNRFASMAVNAGDKQAAREAIGEMGAEWLREVWISSAKFESAKNWAMSE
jgi:hypothetical protein